MFETIMAYGQIVIADLILSGDNALIIGMAAAGLAPELRKKAILYGMIIAAVLRIVFAVVATTLLGIPGILFIGSVLLFWVCWRLFKEIREGMDREAQAALETAGDPSQGYNGPPRKTMAAALISITIADVSMSLDNVLAVAAIANGDKQILVFAIGFYNLSLGYFHHHLLRQKSVLEDYDKNLLVLQIRKNGNLDHSILSLPHHCRRK